MIGPEIEPGRIAAMDQDRGHFAATIATFIATYRAARETLGDSAAYAQMALEFRKGRTDSLAVLLTEAVHQLTQETPKLTTLRDCITAALTDALTDTRQTTIPTIAARIETAVLDLLAPPFAPKGTRK